MAVFRDDPYGRFNFLVDLGAGTTQGAQAGFQECTGLAAEIAVVEYRNGNDKANHVRKLPGLQKTSDVTLKRGVIGATDLFDWLAAAASGNPARRTVRMELQSEDRSTVVATWILSGAWPVKWTGPDLNARSSEVAIEELVLTCDGLAME